MPSIFVIVIVICSGLALSICMREMLLQGFDAFSSRRAESQIRQQMKTVDFQMTGRISDAWLDQLIANIAQQEVREREFTENAFTGNAFTENAFTKDAHAQSNIAGSKGTVHFAAMKQSAKHEAARSGTALQRFDYMVWMIGLAIISFGGLVAGLSQLASQ